jgi:hypothetical protein
MSWIVVTQLDKYKALFIEKPPPPFWVISMAPHILPIIGSTAGIGIDNAIGGRR